MQLNRTLGAVEVRIASLQVSGEGRLALARQV